jgi:hypothetical protein
VFLATLIEQARDVQEQQVRAAERSLPSPTHSQTEPESGAATQTSQTTSQGSSQKVKWVVDWTKDVPLKTEDGYMGPLQPDHFREAYRRYKNSGEGGGAGVEGRSVGLGVTGSGAVRLGGRRLFK